MSYFNPTNVIKADLQKSFEYAIYMIVGSYFKKTVCRNAQKEGAMHINYAETASAIQYEMEAFCDKRAERILHGKAGVLSKETSEVSFLQTNESCAEIRFTGKDVIIRVMGIYRKEGGKIRAETEYQAA